MAPSQPAAGSPGGAATTFTSDLEIALTATETTVQILPGPATKVLALIGEVLKGDPGAVTAVPGYPHAHWAKGAHSVQK